MAVNIHNLIAAVSPDTYCKKDKQKEVKRLVKQGKYLESAEKAEVIDAEYMDFEKIDEKNPMNFPGLKNPVEKHELIYETSEQLLEQTYFWFIDNLPLEYKEGTDKLIDNFVASPGSPYFAEWAGKVQQAQQQAMTMLGSANTVLKSVMNLLYDLREFKLRIEPYDALKSEDKRESYSALLSLKQIWLDTVDAKRGTTSVKGLAISGRAQPGFITLLDAFMKVNKVEEAEKIDLNDVVKRVLTQRIREFNKWLEESEKDLRQRFEIEKSYLKSQINSLKLYARWAKPYLKTTALLEQRATSTASLVTAFNTVLFELTIMAKSGYDPVKEVAKGTLPKFFEKLAEKKKVRNYIPIIIVELKFRSVPEKVGGHQRYVGKAEVVFTSYSLNEDEIKVLKEQLEKDDLDDAMKLIEGTTTESLEAIQEDINEFLESRENKDEEKKEKKSQDINPFTALFSFLKKEKKEKDFSKGIPEDSEYEKVIRSGSIIESRKKTLKIYNLFKKAHEMTSF